MAVSANDDAGWQLATNSAEAYERFLVPALMQSLAETVVDAAAVEAGESVLDVACGTGIVARTAASRTGPDGAVTGLDVNEGMLSVARAVDQPSAPTIEWLHGDVAAMPLPDSTYDVVLCQAALMFFPDAAAATAEMRRVLAPGGRLVMQVFREARHSPAYAVLASCFGRHLGAETGDMVRAIFGLGDPAPIRAWLNDAGFSSPRLTIAVHAARYPSAAEAAWRELTVSPAAALVDGLDENGRAALVADVTEALAPYADDDGVALPLESWIVRATG